MESLAEFGRKLGLDKSTVSRFLARGMPRNVQSANEWRLRNAPPRSKKRKGAKVQSLNEPPRVEDRIEPMAKKAIAAEIAAGNVEPPPDRDESDPNESVKMARLAEKAAWRRFAKSEKEGDDAETHRKVQAAYIAARVNRVKAETDLREWKRIEGITLYYSEAQEIIAKPHQLVAQMLSSMPKQLAPRLVNQKIKQIEDVLAKWCDSVAETIRQGI